MSLRIGQFGVGRIGASHARILSGAEGVDALLVYDPDRERARKLADGVGADVAASPDELIESVDAVVIATPTSTHVDLVTRCLDVGVPTFCEKPMALHLDDMRAILQKVEESSTVLQVGYHRRFDPGYQEARRLRRAGALGHVYAVRLAGHDPAPPPIDYIANSGGIFRDLHIHDFDVLRFVLDQEVTQVFAAGSSTGYPEFSKYGDYDTVVTMLWLSDGTLGVMTGGRENGAGYDIRMEVFGSNDTIAVGLDTRVPLHPVEPESPVLDEDAWPDFQTRFATAYAEELRTFVDVARSVVDNPCTAADAYVALRVAVAASRSAEKQRPVAVDEVS